MNNTFIVSLVIILLLIVSIIIYLYIHNCNGNINKKEGFTSYDSNVNEIQFPTSNYYLDYTYPTQPNVRTTVTSFFNQDGFTSDYQNLFANFLSIIKAFDSELKDMNYNYKVNHIFQVTFPNVNLTNLSSIKILYESFAKGDVIPNVDNQMRGNLLSVTFTRPTGSMNSNCRIIDNTNNNPIIYNDIPTIIRNNQNFSFQIKTSFVRNNGSYFSYVIFSIVDTNSTNVIANIKLDNPSVTNNFISKVRNIAVLSNNGVTFNVESNISGQIYPSYISGTTKRTLINANVINTKISTSLMDFQNLYTSKMDLKNTLRDPEGGVAGISLPITSSIGISINNDKLKSFYFNGEINGVNVYKSIRLPQNDQNEVKQYVYDKGYLIILNTINKIYYCKNCKLHTGEVVWINLTLPQNILTLDKKKIAFDGVNKILFILSYDGVIYYYNGIDNSTATWTLLNPPNEENLFNDFDVIPGKIVILGGYTQFVYLADYTTITLRKPDWKVIDKSAAISSVGLNVKGIMAKDSSGSGFFCQFPCLMKGTNKWVQMGDEVVDGISGNANLLSIVKNNNIYTCTQPCNKDNLNKLNQIGVYSGKVIDYLFPTIDMQTSQYNNIQPINIGSKSTKIDTYSTNINNLLTNIQNNINIFKTKQTEFQNYLNRQITQRDKYIAHIKSGYDCIDVLINSTKDQNNTQKIPQCENYFNNQANYAKELLSYEANEAAIAASEVVTPAPTSRPTPSIDPNSEFFSNNSGKWNEYFTNYAAETADVMIKKLETVKIYKSDLLNQGEDIIAVME